MPSEPRIDAYLQRVARRLQRLSSTRRELELSELRDHLERLVRDRVMRGEPLNDAVTSALLAFGSPDVLGRDLAHTGPRSRRPSRILIVGLGVTVLGVGLAAAQAAAPWDAIDASMKVANEFMTLGKAGDANAASALFSLPERWFSANPRALRKLFDDRANVFQAFESLERETYNAEVQFGQRATINGTVSLRGDERVKFNASFVNVGGTWKMQRFDLE